MHHLPRYGRHGLSFWALSLLIALGCAWFLTFLSSRTTSAAAPALYALAGDARPATDFADLAAGFALRARPVIIDDTIGLDTIHLNLPLLDGSGVIATRNDRESTPAAHLWSGVIAGRPDSEVTLVRRPGAWAGNIRLGDQLFGLRPAGSGQHLLLEYDPAAFPLEAPPLPVADVGGPTGGPGWPEPGSAASPPATADVLVAYTAAAEAAAGGQAAMLSLIDLAVAETNTGFDQSGVSFDLRLVGTQRVSYSESGFNWSQTLSRLRGTTDGYMDEVHVRRNLVGADMVVLIVNDTAYCGLAYLMTTPTVNFASNAFGVVARVCATGYYSFAHEMGHNMGSHHDRANASGPGSYPYSYGFQAPNAAFRTIMAYNCPGGCPRVNHWSNPNVFYGNPAQPMGVPAGQPTAADNRRSLNDNAAIILAWRSPAATAFDYLPLTRR